MMILFVILAVVISVVLGLIVLIQNPKGGGLAGNIAGFSNQFMGVKQTNDVLEKGTWVFGGLIALLCICSAFFIPAKVTATNKDIQEAKGAPIPQSQSANPAPNTFDLNPETAGPGDTVPKN